MKDVRKLLESRKDEMISFLGTLVRIKSFTCSEKELAFAVEAQMKKLGFDSVERDAMGNVIGTVGNGDPLFLFDCHMDTVGVVDAGMWAHDPFGGEISDEKLYGRGSSDMKAGIVSALYALWAVKECGLIKRGKSIWLSCTVCEEDYEGVALRYVLESHNIRPENVIICEPTEGFRVANGHRGRALAEIRAEGKSSHACYPEKGINPVYLLSPVIERIKKRNDEYFLLPGEHPTMALTTFNTVSAGENAVPEEAVITVDRRSVAGESENDIRKEFDLLLDGLENITWRFKDYEARSWTGMDFRYHNCVLAWEFPEDSPLVQSALSAVERVRGKKSGIFRFSGSTNAVTSAGLYGIPTVIVGPGNLSLAHARDEYCPLGDIIDASLIYTRIVGTSDLDEENALR